MSATAQGVCTIVVSTADGRAVNLDEVEAALAAVGVHVVRRSSGDVMPRPPELAADAWATVGGRMAWARTQAALSVAQVAHVLGVDDHVVVDLEADRLGVADLPRHGLARLALAYQRDPAFLEHGQLRELSPELLALVCTCRSQAVGAFSPLFDPMWGR